MDPLGKVELSYTWGLGTDSNNHAEILTLWQRLNLAVEQNVQKILISRHSRIIIQAINNKNKPKTLHLAHIYSKIILLLSKFTSFKIYNILRSLNNLADVEANRGSLMSKNTLHVNGEYKGASIP